MNYNEYLNSSKEEYRLKQEKIFSKISLKTETKEKIRAINRELFLKIYGEIYCPDTKATIPFIEKFRRLNGKIDYDIIVREGNEKEMVAISGDARIPTIMLGDEVILLEFCDFFKDMIAVLDFAERDELIYKYRTGKFNDEIEEELVNLLVKFGG